MVYREVSFYRIVALCWCCLLWHQFLEWLHLNFVDRLRVILRKYNELFRFFRSQNLLLNKSARTAYSCRIYHSSVLLFYLFFLFAKKKIILFLENIFKLNYKKDTDIVIKFINWQNSWSKSQVILELFIIIREEWFEKICIVNYCSQWLIKYYGYWL